MEHEALLESCIAEFRMCYKNGPTKIPVFKEQVELWQRQFRISKILLLNIIARHLACEFYNDRLEFAFCSNFMRNLMRASLGDWPDLFWDLYIAFDAGETGRIGQSGDPVETHTRPMIREILARQQ